MSVDPYQVLGVPYNADEDEIKKKYRTLVKQYHPDLHPNDPEAARKMSEINAAYEMIKSGQADPYRGGQSYSSGNYNSGGTAYTYEYSNMGDMDDFLNSFFSAFGFGTAASQMNEGEIYEKVSRYISVGDFSAAASLLNRVVIRGGKWHYYAAQVCSASGEYADAVRYADEAKRSDPSDPDYAELSAEYHRRYDKALRRRRILPNILSAVTMLLVVTFIVRMVIGFFGFLFMI